MYVYDCVCALVRVHMYVFVSAQLRVRVCIMHTHTSYCIYVSAGLHPNHYFFARRATSFVLFPWVDISILRLLVAVSQFVFCCERIFPYWYFKEHLRVGKY